MNEPVIHQAIISRFQYMRKPYQFPIPLLLAFLCACVSDKPDDVKKTTPQSPPAISIKASNFKEGASGSFQILASRVYTDAIVVDLNVSMGTADQNDVTEIPITVTLPPNMPSITIPLSPVDDGIHEGQEDFTIEINRVSVGTISLSQKIATFKIDDNDPAPTVSFDRLSTLISEDIGTFAPSVSLNLASSKELTVEVTYSGTAIPEDDFVNPTTTVVIPAGNLQESFPVDIISDVIPEGGETLIAKLVDRGTYAIGDQSSHTTIISGDASLNDTGIATFYDGLYFNQVEANTQYPGQDASYGADKNDLESLDGHRGFSLTKLDYAGNEQSYTASSWSCVRDNKTGLIWEVKEPAYDLQLLENDLADTEIKDKAYKNFHQFRSANFLYTWHSPVTTNDGRSPGSPNDQFEAPRNYDLNGYCGYKYEKTSPPWVRRCNTEIYINEMNWYGICGSKKWRLPTAEELRTLTNYDYDYARQQGLYFPIELFPNTQSNALYYSSTPSAEFDASVWCVDVSNGELKLCNKQSIHSVRLVTDSQ